MAIQLVGPNNKSPEHQKLKAKTDVSYVDKRDPGEKGKTRKKLRPLELIMILMIVCTAGASAVFFMLGYKDYRKTKNMELMWVEVSDIANETDEDTGDGKFPVDTTNTYEDDVTGEKIKASASTDDPLFRYINFKGLTDINDDVKGYIYVPDIVDYPVLREITPEEYFYQKHNIYEKYDIYGSIFELCDEQLGGSRGPINYMFGHHMATQDMFTPLFNYENEDFVDTPIYVYREDGRAEYKVWAVCVVNKRDEVFNFGDYKKDSKEYQELIERLSSESIVKGAVSAPSKSEDTLLLSTCRGRSGTPVRFIVLAKKVRGITISDSDLEDVVYDNGSEASTEETTEETTESE